MTFTAIPCYLRWCMCYKWCTCTCSTLDYMYAPLARAVWRLYGTGNQSEAISRSLAPTHLNTCLHQLKPYNARPKPLMAITSSTAAYKAIHKYWKKPHLPHVHICTYVHLQHARGLRLTEPSLQLTSLCVCAIPNRGPINFSHLLSWNQAPIFTYTYVSISHARLNISYMVIGVFTTYLIQGWVYTKLQSTLTKLAVQKQLTNIIFVHLHSYRITTLPQKAH